MPTKKRTTASKWVDANEAPHLGRDWFKRAEIREGNRLIRRPKLGRPKKAAPKSGSATALRAVAGTIETDLAQLASGRATLKAALTSVSNCSISLIP